MPRQSSTLTEAEIKTACAFWLEKGCPLPNAKFSAHLSVDRPTNPTPTDPGNGVTATVWFD